MKNGIFPALLAALLLTTVQSDARSRRGPSDGGGGLASDRGVSRVESLAIEAVLKETAGSRAGAGNAASSETPRRNLSADYYRVYSQRRQGQAGTRKVAVTPAAAPARAAVVRPQKVAQTQKVAAAAPKVRIGVFKPKTAAAAPIARPLPPKARAIPPTARALPPKAPRRVAVAEAKPRALVEAPIATRAAKVQPRRVAMAPAGKPAPRTAAPLPAKPGSPAPTRVVFRD